MAYTILIDWSFIYNGLDMLEFHLEILEFILGKYNWIKKMFGTAKSLNTANPIKLTSEVHVSFLVFLFFLFLIYFF